MFCTNCGRQNDEGMAYCENCGNPLETSVAEKRVPPQPRAGVSSSYGNLQPQVQYAQQNNPMQHGPFGSVPPQTPYVNSPYGPAFSPAPAKKKKTGLIVGLSVGAAAVILAVVVILLIAGRPPVVGTWYSEDRGVILEFKENGIVVSRSASGRDEGNYTFNANNDTGMIKADNNTYEYTMRGKTIDVENIGQFKKADADFDTQEFINESRGRAGAD
jgi:hypothetical protein